MHGDETRFVEVNGKTCSGGKIVKHHFEVGNSLKIGPAENQCVISVLENGARKIRGKRVVHLSVDPSLADETLENVSHNDKEVGG
jgi:hypothetical protein